MIDSAGMFLNSRAESTISPILRLSTLTTSSRRPMSYGIFSNPNLALRLIGRNHLSAREHDALDRLGGIRHWRDVLDHFELLNIRASDAVRRAGEFEENERVGS